MDYERDIRREAWQAQTGFRMRFNGADNRVGRGVAEYPVALRPGSAICRWWTSSGWATGFEERVKAGMDPLFIQGEVFDSLAAKGVTEPYTALRRTWSGSQVRIYANMNRQPASSVLLPVDAVSTEATPDERRAAFLEMLETLREQAESGHERRPEDLQTGGYAERTAFSLAELLPLPAQELQPTWAGWRDTERGGVKLRAWGAYSGLRHADVSVEEGGALRVVRSRQHQHDRQLLAVHGQRAQKHLSRGCGNHCLGQCVHRQERYRRRQTCRDAHGNGLSRSLRKSMVFARVPSSPSSWSTAGTRRSPSAWMTCVPRRSAPL